LVGQDNRDFNNLLKD